MTWSPRQQQITRRLGESAAVASRNWHWQMRHAVRDLDTFERLLGIALPDEQRQEFADTIAKFPMSITPYYLSLHRPGQHRKRPRLPPGVPLPLELRIQNCDLADPLHEDADSPAPCITHRYPDRVLFLVSNMCAMYCRHCTRKRRVGDVDNFPDRAETSGRPRLRPQHPRRPRRPAQRRRSLPAAGFELDWLLGELRAIPHVEVVRIGTRTPVVLPYRIPTTWSPCSAATIPCGSTPISTIPAN